MDVREAVTKLFSAGILLSILEFVGIAYFTRTLGAGAIGSFFLYQAVVGVAAILGNFGLGRAAEQNLSAGEDAGEVLATVVLLKGFLLIPLVLVILLGQEYVTSYIGLENAALLLTVGVVTMSGKRLANRLLAGQMQVEKTASVKVAGKVAWIVVGAGLIYYGIGTTAILIGFLVGDVVSLAVATVYLDLSVGRPSLNRARSMLGFGYYILLRSSGSYIYSWMDVIVLGFFVPQAHIGAYEIAWRVSALTMKLPNAIRESLFPKISELNSNGQIDRIGTLLARWTQPPLFLSIPALFGAIVLGEEVLTVLFGNEIGLGFAVLVIFMVEKNFRTIHLLYSAAVYAMNRPNLGYRGEIAGLGSNLVLNVALVPFFGIIGAAVATTVSSVVAMAINSLYLSTMVDLRVPWPGLTWATLSAALMAGSVLLIKPLLPGGVVGLVIGVSGGVLIYALLLMSNTEIRHSITRIRNRSMQGEV